MIIRAVIDRLEGETAVLLLGPEETRVNFPLRYLPIAHEGAVLEFSIEPKPEDETARRKEAEQLLAKLKAKHNKT